MIRFVALLAAFVTASACQTYDFERVSPLAVGQTTDKKVVASKRLKPNIMLLVDFSGSMAQPTNPGDPRCPAATCPGMNCPANCPTRISELKSSMSMFLTSSSTVARFGAAIFPVVTGTTPEGQCGPTTDLNQQNLAIKLPDPTVNDDGTEASLTASASSVNSLIQARPAAGGTPTGPSLTFLGTYGGLTDLNDFRDDFVLLLTDGLPNCNATNEDNICTNASDPAAVAKCACVSASCGGLLCSLGCLDDGGAVSAIRGLKQKNIRTIVVGFGADTAAGSGPAVLNAMASEGGFARKCESGLDSECGTGNTCDATKLCSTAFYQAANGAELSAALASISASIRPGDECIFPLTEKPSNPAYLSVVIDGANTVAGADTYGYNFARNEVTFTGALCTRIKASTNANSISVEFRIAQKL